MLGILLGLMAARMLCGCAYILPKSTKVKGGTVEIWSRTWVKDDDGFYVPVEWKGEAKGPEASSFNSAGSGEMFDMEAPTLEHEDSGASAGAFSYTAKGLASRGPVIICVLGGLMFAGGAVCFFLWNKKLGLVVGVAGLALILVGAMLERYPWVALALPVLGIGAAVYFLWRARQGKRTEQSLNAVVTGVAKLEKDSPNSAELAKQKIGEDAGDKDGPVRATIRKVKKKLGLTK